MKNKVSQLFFQTFRFFYLYHVSDFNFLIIFTVKINFQDFWKISIGYPGMYNRGKVSVPEKYKVRHTHIFGR